jgi:hypothetical protein
VGRNFKEKRVATTAARFSYAGSFLSVDAIRRAACAPVLNIKQFLLFETPIQALFEQIFS